MGSVGLAMIARNGADTIEAALRPFCLKVDEISIVLGGYSDDATAAIAGRYVPHLGMFAGELFEDGSLTDFALARQQSFDQLDTDWAIVVDADDCWEGVENLRGLIDKAESLNGSAITVPYVIGRSLMLQPRIFRIDAGRWLGPIHEEFRLEPGAVNIQTNELLIRQQATDEAHRWQRNGQNLRIAERYLLGHPADLRTLAHLAKDYQVAEHPEKALEMVRRYLDAWQAQDEPEFNNQHSFVLQTKGTAELSLGEAGEALQTAARAIDCREGGGAWSLLAEAALSMSTEAGSGGLLDLAIFAGERAMAQGKPRRGYPEGADLSGPIPAYLKATAQFLKGDWRPALATADLGLLIDPRHPELNRLRETLCEKLNEVP